MASSNVAKGAYYKARTRKWLEAHGWEVADLEIVKWVGGPARRFPIKRDQFGSDLLAVNAHGVTFVQVKGGKAASGGTFPAARREFAKFTFPPFAQRVVVAWSPRSREPRIVDGVTGKDIV